MTNNDKANPIEMRPELRSAIENIRKLLNGGDLKKYEAGRVVARIVAEGARKTYGEGAVKKAADALDIAESRLYAWAQIAKVLKLNDVMKWLRQVGSGGFRLRFSHLELAAGHNRTKQEVEGLLEDALTNALSTRALAEKLDAKTGAGGTTRTRTGPAGALEASAKAIERWRKTVQHLRQTLSPPDFGRILSAHRALLRSWLDELDRNLPAPGESPGSAAAQLPQA